MKKVFSNRMNGCSLIHFSFLLAFLFLSVNAEAKVKLPSVLADNMVLQQQTDVKLWASASQSNPDSKDLVEQQNIQGYR